jgi:hypothetical protein
VSSGTAPRDASLPRLRPGGLCQETPPHRGERDHVPGAGGPAPAEPTPDRDPAAGRAGAVDFFFTFPLK